MGEHQQGEGVKTRGKVQEGELRPQATESFEGLGESARGDPGRPGVEDDLVSWTRTAAVEGEDVEGSGALVEEGVLAHTACDQRGRGHGRVALA